MGRLPVRRVMESPFGADNRLELVDHGDRAGLVRVLPQTVDEHVECVVVLLV